MRIHNTVPSGKNTPCLTQSWGGAHGPPPWLQPTYVLDESDPDILMLRRADGSFVAAFSAQGATREGIRQAAEEDWRQRNPLGSEHRASHVSQPKAEGDPITKTWEEFLEAERQALRERKGGQLAKTLGKAAPGESQEELVQLTRDDQRRAEEGLVEVLREGEKLFKHIDELTPEDVPGRRRAERTRLLWIKARQEYRKPRSTRLPAQREGV
jgi:hypothetical protein